METKQEIRRMALKKRDGLPPDVRRIYSGKITGRVLCHPFFQCAETVFCYAAFRGEADTYELAHNAWKMGKTVAFPRVFEDGRMEFYRVDNWEELHLGYQNIMEPDKKRSRLLRPEADPERRKCVMLLPGATFDRNGCRIGYGKGFYDRYLQRYPYAKKIGLAFFVQCVEKIPAEAHDISMDAVITELGDYMR